jgi:Protein of unknown function (DUF3015)
MKILKVAALALVLAVPTLASAQAKKSLNPWIDCGIGAMIFAETDWAAVTSNVIWDLGTTAVTSDQSSQNTCNSKKAKTAMYIGATYASLSEEAVKGDGTHLRAMLQVAGCDTAAHGSMIATLRSDFGQALRAPGYAAMSHSAKAEGFYNLVQTSVEGQYAQQCRAV